MLKKIHKIKIIKRTLHLQTAAMAWLCAPADLDGVQSSAWLWVRVGEEHATYCRGGGGQIARLAPRELKTFLCLALAPRVYASIPENKLATDQGRQHASPQPPYY